MGATREQPKIIPRKSKDGSISSVTYEFPYMLQPEKKTLRQLIYSSKSGKVLGRTPKNWGELFVFYTVFYIVLAALFAICMKGLLMSCPDNMPKWQLGESLIGSSPGVGFRPLPEDVDHGSLIWYDASNQTQVIHWKSLLDDFLHEYTLGSSNQKICDFDAFPGTTQACKLDMSQFDQCSSAHSYGYNNSSPCIFIKLNRIYGWVPEYYNDINDLPEEMPDDLKAYITELPEMNRSQVWVSCYGENGADREVLGEIKYYPSRGFPSYFFPYLNAPGYHSPLVAVKFVRPTPNQIINIECRAWAKNIKYVGSFRDRQGSVHLELMIDAPTK